MSEQDEALARRYRELAREEPGAALDTRILAASRRAVARRSFTRRWAAPLSIAAVLVLAVGISLQVQRQEPRMETAAPAAEEKAAARLESSRAAQPEHPEQRSAAASGAVTPEPALLAPAAPTQPLTSSDLAGATTRSPFATEAKRNAASAAAPDPAAQLDRIARLREAGHAREADEALAQFRRDFPDYRIPDATWERVRPR